MGTSESNLGIEEYHVDLEDKLPEEFEKKFNVVFNHTTLEHIYENRVAFANLCTMAEDAVIVVVPWIQEVHVTDSYKDYWRYSPFTMEKMYEENGFSMVVCSNNNEFDTATYLFCIGIRNNKLSQYPNFEKIKVTNEKPVGRWIGKTRKREIIAEKAVSVLKKQILHF